MKKLIQSGAFKKDLKRIKHQKKKLAALELVLHYLRLTGSVPREYLPHRLKGQYNGCIECHINGDFLLIWIDIDSDSISLVRLGSHSEVFGM